MSNELRVLELLPVWEDRVGLEILILTFSKQNGLTNGNHQENPKMHLRFMIIIFQIVKI